MTAQDLISLAKATDDIDEQVEKDLATTNSVLRVPRNI